MATIHPLLVSLSAICLSVSIVLYARRLHNPTAYYLLPTAWWVAFIYAASWLGWLELNNPVVLSPFARAALALFIISVSVFFLQAVFRENTEGENQNEF
ncbi:MAG TPA: hypothetical protein VJ044_07685 [Candidatus Hodarchaeales archaeon]|nr:hypothetical protein [Candidatus Hodarchaeales archaeon]